MDPEGYYAQLGVAPDAKPAAIAAAFRRKARLLHPDVPVTGDAQAFILVRQAYDVLSDDLRRARYDRSARTGHADTVQPEMPDPTELPPLPELPELPLRSRTMRQAFWAGLILLTGVSLYEMVVHLVDMFTAPMPPALNALTSEPAKDAAMVPVGTPTHYVLPSGGAAPLWRFDAAHNGYVPAAHLEPFTGVAVLDTPPRDGMVEVQVSSGHGFIDASRLAVGDAQAARRAYCGYNAGPPLAAGEVLTRHGGGNAVLGIDNTAAEPLVVKLRNAKGTTTLTVEADQGITRVAGLPPGRYTAEYASGTLWSRACGSFLAGERTWRLDTPVQISGDAHLAIPAPDATEIAPDAFADD